ncbi:diguanylate cyclase domain-containing protein [Tepidimonas sp.]
MLSTLTVSLGVACRLPGESGEALIARADAALYRSKQNGRNQVSIATES